MNVQRAIERADGTWEFPCPMCPLLFDDDAYEGVLEVVADHILEEHDDVE